MKQINFSYRHWFLLIALVFVAAIEAHSAPPVPSRAIHNPYVNPSYEPVIKPPTYSPPSPNQSYAPPRQSYRSEMAGNNGGSSTSSGSGGQQGGGGGSDAMTDGTCDAAFGAKLTLAVAAGSCDALNAGGSGGSSICGNEMGSGGGGQGAKYDMASHEPDKSGGISAKNNATDCSGVPCLAWGASGFMPEGKPLNECPTANDWADKKSDCLEQVSDKKYKIGDLVCGKGEGNGHCAFICDQDSSTGGQPTDDLSKLTACEAIGKSQGWKQRSAKEALTNSKLAGGTILRPAGKDKKPNCYGQPQPVKGAGAMKSCPGLPKIDSASKMTGA